PLGIGRAGGENSGRTGIDRSSGVPAAGAGRASMFVASAAGPMPQTSRASCQTRAAPSTSNVNGKKHAALSATRMDHVVATGGGLAQNASSPAPEVNAQ